MKPKGVAWRTRKKRNDDFGVTDEDGYTAHLGVKRVFKEQPRREKYMPGHHTPEAIRKRMQEKIENSDTTEDIELREHEWLFSESQMLDLITQANDLQHFEELFKNALEEVESE